MAITYRPMPGYPSIKMPVLHRVIYDARSNEVLPSWTQRSYKDHLVDQWLKANCRSPYYHSPGYLREKFIEFEDDAEAVAFALRWA